MPKPEAAAEHDLQRRGASIVSEGTRMLPVPRTIDASVLTSQMTIAPASATLA